MSCSFCVFPVRRRFDYRAKNRMQTLHVEKIRRRQDIFCVIFCLLQNSKVVANDNTYGISTTSQRHLSFVKEVCKEEGNCLEAVFGNRI